MLNIREGGLYNENCQREFVKENERRTEMDESIRMMLGLVVGIAVMIFLVSKTKVHTFIALLAACVVSGVIGGMPLVNVTQTLADGSTKTITGMVTAIKDGFGNTLKSTGIIIGLAMEELDTLIGEKNLPSLGM